MTRVAVFIDYQNVYMRAREAFAAKGERFVAGQVDPLALGNLVVSKGLAVDPSRRLHAVKAFRGEPSAKHSPTGQAACQRQVQAWSGQRAVEVFARPLRYRNLVDRFGNQMVEAQEKGIDVMIALAIALGAERDEYDVCVLCSADTDLIPALEQARLAGKTVGTAAWQPPTGYARSLRLPGMWCHRLRAADYQSVADRRDYSKGSVPGGPRS